MRSVDDVQGWQQAIGIWALPILFIGKKEINWCFLSIIKKNHGASLPFSLTPETGHAILN